MTALSRLRQAAFPLLAAVVFVAAVTLIIVSLVSTEDDDRYVLVTVEGGTLRGETVAGVYNTPYTRFLAIPYAQPPIGELRFAAPLPASPWSGVRDATQLISNCTQSGDGTEDCLFLNVYVPIKGDNGVKDNLAVYVYVHGGKFNSGSGSYHKYGPDFFMDFGIILVAINYRLGPLGFLSFEDEYVPGNAAQKDQVLALKWVQSNIAYFGGDPTRVTLAGQSSGAGVVSLHLASPLSAGLFQRMIVESGNFVAPSYMVLKPREVAFRLGAVLGCETNDSLVLLDFLRSVKDSDLFVDNSLIMTEEEKLFVAYLPWAPTIEPDIEGAFMPESPIQILNDGRFHNIPLLTGVTSNERGDDVINDPERIANLDQRFTDVVAPCIHLPTVEWQQTAALEVREFYYGSGNITLEEDADSLVYMDSDIMYAEPTDSFVRTVANLSENPVFYYEFDFRGNNVNATAWGVKHAGELPIIWRRDQIIQNVDPESEEDQVRRNMLRLWTNFAKYGNPTPEPDPVIWEPYNLENKNFLLIQTVFSLQADKDAERLDFWHERVPSLPYPK